MHGTFGYCSLSNQAFVPEQVMLLQRRPTHINLGQALRWGEVSGALTFEASPIIPSSSLLLGCPGEPVVAFF